MNLTLLSSLISAGIAATLAWGAAWHFQGVKITEMKLEAANDRITAQRVARQNIDRALSRLSTAQAQAQDRARVIAAELDANRSELERLRDTSASSVRAAAGDPAACSAKVAAYDLISTQCAAQLTDMARDADGWVSHALTLQEGWSK